uniref:Uncharacterized protein n=1 Tax=Trypanosoma vivax (strain Y486) TaxID=1055687 RepID=G0TUV4_TRYVY|nr:conserved hypothetical protein [Trypanosoma vivax Y486]
MKGTVGAAKHFTKFQTDGSYLFIRLSSLLRFSEHDSLLTFPFCTPPSLRKGVLSQQQCGNEIHLKSLQRMLHFLRFGHTLISTEQTNDVDVFTLQHPLHPQFYLTLVKHNTNSVSFT